MSQLRLSLRQAALAAAVVATAPYVILKLLWLSGSTVGMTGGTSATEMTSARFVAGNVVTVVLMLVAVAFAAALTRPWARRVPAWIVVVLAGGATGLLAPILLGLPLGLALQLAVRGEVEPADDAGLAGWVFGVVYSGFGLLAIALAVLVASYVVDRWGYLISEPPRRPARLPTLAGALGLVPFGAAMSYWGAFGPGTAGPRDMDLPAQRTVLAVTGMLALAAFVVPFLARSATGWPRLAWLITWTGCCVAALQGPAQILLAQGGDVQPVIGVIALLATPGGLVYGLTVLRRRAAEAGSMTAAGRTGRLSPGGLPVERLP